mmetsp:Transcript_32905/g.52475  ORF Transcript_32905/g.52475 Transcript_32905/m.52475 type:complete len:386 (+) Transcript_32905:3023-4180(+)
MEYTDVTITVKEKNMVQMKAETYVEGNGSAGGVETSITLNNSLGVAEKISGSVSYGSKSSAAGRLGFVQPRFQGYPFTLDMHASHSTISRAIFSSYNERVQGLHANFKHEDGKHEIGVGTAWRDIIPLRKENSAFEYAASGLIIAQARPSLKNSIIYTFTNDTRDHPYGPTVGSLFRLTSEFAGFGGDVNFFKGQVKAQQFWKVLEKVVPGVSVGLGFHVGALYPLSEDTPRFRHQKQLPEGTKAVGGSSAISDRFWLGGPLSLRGFNHKGVGPRTNPKLQGAKGGDSLGGDVTWSIGSSLYFPFPHPTLNAAGLRCHLFANAGNLCAWETSFRTLVRGVRVSVGGGLVFPTMMGRIEANYAFVLRANSRDQQKRFQLGLGLDFL